MAGTSPAMTPVGALCGSRSDALPRQASSVSTLAEQIDLEMHFSSSDHRATGPSLTLFEANDSGIAHLAQRAQHVLFCPSGHSRKFADGLRMAPSNGPKQHAILVGQQLCSGLERVKSNAGRRSR